MADPKDKAGMAPEPKPTGKPAAVKPPVLEGAARPAGSAKPAAAAKGGLPPKAEGKKEEPPKPASATPLHSQVADRDTAQPQGRNSGGAWIAGIVGGALGLGGAYALAVLGYWPTPAPAPLPEDPRIAQVSASVPELEARASELQQALSALDGRVAEIEAQPQPQPVAQTTPAPDEALAEAVASLTARVDELAATPQDAQDASAANAASIANLEAELEALRQSAAQTQSSLGTATNRLDSLEDELDAGIAAEAGQTRLPLLVSGFETAFATGAPYQAELDAVRNALPDLEVPQPVSAGSGEGLKRPDLVARDFRAALPEILAGRPFEDGASWQETTSDWFRGIIALRPTEAVEGNEPEAMVARLEGAIERGDFVAAQTEWEALPQPMQAAAGAVGEDIATQAAAQNFLLALRQAALGQEGGA